MSSPFVSSAGSGILLPEQVGELIVTPLAQQSVIMAVSTRVPATSSEFRFPRVQEEVSCSWTGEAQPLDESAPTVDELKLGPSKVTCLVAISRELANDSNPAAAQVVGDSVVRSLAATIDTAAFGTNAGNVNAPKGLGDLIGYQEVDAGTFDNLDFAIEAESKLNRIGSTATSFVMSANTLRTLAQLKEFAPTSMVVSNENLLSADPTQRTRYAINGTPAHWVRDGVLEDGTIYALHDQLSFVLVRADAEIVVLPWPGFTSDLVYLRCIMRLAFAWPKPTAVVRITGVIPGGS